jgi:hypothetical protein
MIYRGPVNLIKKVEEARTWRGLMVYRGPVEIIKKVEETFT